MGNEWGTILQLFTRSLETGSVYALAALGIIIIYRTSVITHFAQGSMGMFSTFVVTYAFLSLRLPLWLSTLCGVVSAVFTGFLVDVLIIRRTKKVSPVGKQIITLGLIMVFLGLAPMMFGVAPLLLPRFIQSGDLSFGGASISYNAILNISLGLLIMGILFYVLQETKMGLAIRATASNEPVARLMGVPTRQVTLTAWALAGILGCLSGVMIAPTTTVTTVLMNPVQVNALFACVLGGFQSFYGPVLGAYIIGVGRNLLVYYVSSIWGEQIMYLLILIFLIFRPNGIIGQKFIKKV
ncbi:MAG: branched-chain amino acid ABC transporter permease [Synergistaceae bacterium]|nr:branched-chain amino acid ABC transporter permease [Synergistaceae bacterium]